MHAQRWYQAQEGGRSARAERGTAHGEPSRTSLAHRRLHMAGETRRETDRQRRHRQHVVQQAPVLGHGQPAHLHADRENVEVNVVIRAAVERGRVAAASPSVPASNKTTAGVAAPSITVG